MIPSWIPWSLRSKDQFLNSYGDAFLFRGIRKTPPIECNPDADTGLHSAVPHRYVHAYLLAAKSFLRYHADIAVFVHDDGSLQEGDKALVRRHLPGVRIIERREADERFEREVADPFLSKVRSSYTSYLKLFDPTLFSGRKRIIIVDTDTLFLRRPDAVIDWACNGGAPWFHLAPKGKMKKEDKASNTGTVNTGDKHIQTMIMSGLDEINAELDTRYTIEQGFCSGFIGYETGTIRFDALKKLFEVLFSRYGDRIFRWGAEQTVHGLNLCASGARALPIDDYFVFTQFNAEHANRGTFVHFVGENRFYQMRYPKLAKEIVAELGKGDTP
jgi:hypothetical protein